MFSVGEIEENQNNLPHDSNSVYIYSFAFFDMTTYLHSRVSAFITRKKNS